MNSEDIKLIEPTVALESEFFAIVEEFKAEGDTSINGIGSIDIDDFVSNLQGNRTPALGLYGIFSPWDNF